MNKKFVFVIVFGLLTLLFAMPVLAHEGCEVIKTFTDGATILYCPAVPAPTPTSVIPTPTPTPTSVIPTPTPTATSVIPTATPAPVGTPIAMYPTAPKCSTHDGMAWHDVWDEVRGCYYDHSHGDDPKLGDDIFGPIEPLLGGSWIPPFGQSFEHHMGAQHGGWKVEVNRNLPQKNCGVVSSDCIDASRLVTHQGLPGSSRGIHTFFAQYRIKHPDGTYSMISTGGAWVVPYLMAPYKQATVLSDVPLEQLNQWQIMPGYGYAKNAPDSADPYRAHTTCANMKDFVLKWMEPKNKRYETSSENVWQQKFWIMDDDNPGPEGARLYGMNPFVEVATNVADTTACIVGDHTGIKSEPWVFQLDPVACPKLPNGAIGCRQNDSYGPHLFSAEVDMGYRTAWIDNSQWDRDTRKGWVEVNAFIKPMLKNADGTMIIGRDYDVRRFFTEAASCTAVGPECAPLVYKGRVTYAYWDTPVASGPWNNKNYDAGYVMNADGSNSTLLPGFENVWWLSEAN